MTDIKTIRIPGDNRSWQARYHELEASNRKLINDLIDSTHVNHGRITALEALLRETRYKIAPWLDGEDKQLAARIDTALQKGAANARPNPAEKA